MDKVDHKKSPQPGKAKNHQSAILDVPKCSNLMIDGHGDPNTSKEFADAIKALYPVAYKLKFASRLELVKIIPLCHLEGRAYGGLMI